MIFVMKYVIIFVMIHVRDNTRDDTRDDIRDDIRDERNVVGAECRLLKCDGADDSGAGRINMNGREQ